MAELPINPRHSGPSSPFDIVAQRLAQHSASTGEDTTEGHDPAADNGDPTVLPAWSPGAVPVVPVDMSAFGSAGGGETSSIPDWLHSSSSATDAYRTTNPIDRQIASVTDAMRRVSSDSSRMLAQKQLLNAIAAAAQDAKHTGDKQFDLTTLMVATTNGESIPASRALEQAGLLEIVNPSGDGKTSANGIQSAIESIDASMSRVNGDSQLRMIQLQDLMHQRDLFLQLATNQLSSRQQIERRIAENIR